MGVMGKIQLVTESINCFERTDIQHHNCGENSTDRNMECDTDLKTA